MKGTENEVYDATLEYENEVKPLVEKLVQVCNLYRIPMFFCAAPKNTKTDTVYEKTILSPAQYNTRLQKNYFSDFINVVNGLVTTYYQAPGDQQSNEEYEDLVKLMQEGQDNIKELDSLDEAGDKEGE